MTYAQVVHLLEGYAKQLGMSFWHGRRSESGINYDEPFPQLHLFLMSDVVGATVIRRSIGLGFFGKDEEAGTSDQMLTIQDDMDQLSQQFISMLEGTADVQIVGDVSRMTTVRRGAHVGTGYYVDFTLNSIRTIC